MDACKLSYNNITALDKGIVDRQGCYLPSANKDTCAGFAGAGVQVQFDNYEYLVGVASFIHKCEGEKPRVYSKVSAYIDWLEAVIWTQDL